MAFDKLRRRLSKPANRSRGAFNLRAALALAALFAGGTSQALPSEFSARYEVSHAGLTLGEAVVAYREPAPGRYRYSSVTRPLGIAALIFRSEIKEVSEGRITDDGFRPDRYEYDRTGRGAREANLVFDWTAMRVINQVSGEAWKMPIPKDTMDRMVSQLQLMRDLANQEKDLNYRIADGGRIKEYTLRIDGRQILPTPYGKLETVKITRITDSDRRATTFWLAPALEYLAVRIDHREKGDNFSMTLEGAKGFSVRPDQRRSTDETGDARLLAADTSHP
jgi:hypothetical protein